MKRFLVASMVFTLFLVGPVLAKSKAPAPKRSAQEVFDLLDQTLNNVEKRQPQEQATCFRIRELATELKNRALSAESQFQGPRGSRTPPQTPFDPDIGVNLYDSCRDLQGDELKEKLAELMSGNYPIGYQSAQDLIFSKVHNFDGEVECVYTGRRLQTQGEPSADNMNIEHTWPQSQGATGIAKSDLHHLFPTDSKANNIRSSFPFGDVGNPTWEQGGSKFSGKEFEVRDEHKGNCARAKFYFAVRYGKSIPPREETVLRRWAEVDPVDDAERARNDLVENLQHNRNAFVDHPEYIKAIADF